MKSDLKAALILVIGILYGLYIIIITTTTTIPTINKPLLKRLVKLISGNLKLRNKSRVFGFDTWYLLVSYTIHGRFTCLFV